jgi:hypothetical protein
MTDDQQSRLAQLGDRLEAAVADQIARGDESRSRPEPEVSAMVRMRSRRRLVVGGIVGGLVVAGVGTAAAIAALDEDEVERGMPAGAVLLQESEPTCTALLDDVFWCELAEPLPEVMVPVVTDLSVGPTGSAVPSEADAPISSEEVTTVTQPSEVPSNYRGTVEIFLNAENRQAGGCVAIDQRGQTWLCVAGQRAVDIEMLAQSLLGQPAVGPAAG